LDKTAKITAYYAQEHPFSKGIDQLREIALGTEVEETFKWQFPTYTVAGKNVFAICRFKGHFGIWFFNGVFLSDPLGVLQNAQKGKTMAMRHWKFTKVDTIQKEQVLQYMQEAIQNQKLGKVRTVQKKNAKPAPMPLLLRDALDNDTNLRSAFDNLTPYKQKEYAEYIGQAKQERTKLKRLENINYLIQVV